MKNENFTMYSIYDPLSKTYYHSGSSGYGNRWRKYPKLYNRRTLSCAMTSYNIRRRVVSKNILTGSGSNIEIFEYNIPSSNTDVFNKLFDVKFDDRQNIMSITAKKKKSTENEIVKTVRSIINDGVATADELLDLISELKNRRTSSVNTTTLTVQNSVGGTTLDGR